MESQARLMMKRSFHRAILLNEELGRRVMNLNSVPRRSMNARLRARVDADSLPIRDRGW